MSNRSQIFSDEALLQRVQEMEQSMSELMLELRNLRRQVWEAEARALAKRRQRSSVLHDRNRRLSQQPASMR